MYCKYCGSDINPKAKFCSNCGGPNGAAQQPVQETNQDWQQEYHYQTTGQNGAPVYYVQTPGQGQYYGGYQGTSVDFGEAIKRVFNHFADFNGRASRSEFWWGILFLFIVSWVGVFIPLVNLVLWIPVLIAQLALEVRRLHDIGRSGVYLLLGLIPCAGIIVLLVFYCSESVGDNQWGPVYRVE